MKRKQSRSRGKQLTVVRVTLRHRQERRREDLGPLKAVVAVRFTNAERKRVARAAQAEGLTSGVWLRRLALLSLGMSSE